MGTIFLLVLTWLAPLVGGPLLGAAVLAGWLAPHEAFPLAWLTLALRRSDSRGLFGRLFSAALLALLLLAAGVLLARLWSLAFPSGLRVGLVLLLWSATAVWLWLTLLNPQLLKKLHLPAFPARKSKSLLVVAVIFLIPLIARSGSTQAVGAFAEAELRKKSIDLRSELIQLDPVPKGLGSLFRETRLIAHVAPKGQPNEVFLVRVSHDSKGDPTALTGAYNLSETGAVGEEALTVSGHWAAWKLPVPDGGERLEVANLSGEGGVQGRVWSLIPRAQRAITNYQETGHRRGIGRTTVSPVPSGPINQFSLSGTELRVAVGQTSVAWPLGGLFSSKGQSPTLVVEPVPPPPSGSLVTWAVDRVRGISWIGSDRLQWLKAVVYDLATKAEDVSEQIAATDPEAQVAEELGDVWSRLPVVEESSYSNWPPAPLVPKLNQPLPGEGQWIDLTHEKAFSTLDTASMLFTFIRVDRKRAYNQVSIAVWDPRRIELHIVAGTEEPKSTLGQRGTGLIPRTPQKVGRLVAAFNGAFQAVHGEFGMMEQKVVQLPPKPFAATVATDQDGGVSFGTWPGTPTSIPANMRGFRQNMTALVGPTGHNPYRRHWWGGVPEGWHDASRTVRSGICKTKEGYIAYFYSPSIDPEQLGEAMMIARCDYGIHLDMNGGHAGFELYRVGPTESLPPVTRALDSSWEAVGKVPDLPGYSFNARLLVRQMPLMNFPRYIKTTPRDFFYLTERPVLPGPALMLPPPMSASAWKTIKTPGNEHPPFLVRSQVSLEGSTASISLSRIDPGQLAVTSGETVIGFGSPTEGELGLFWKEGRFSISAEPPEAATLITRGGPEGPHALCVGTDGSLTVVGELENETQLSLILGALSCQGVLRLTSPLSLLLGDESKESNVRFGRRAPLLAQALFPDTPVVPPQIWGIPQARSATLVGPNK